MPMIVSLGRSYEKYHEATRHAAQFSSGLVIAVVRLNLGSEVLRVPSD